jgi:hypothetical protein
MVGKVGKDGTPIYSKHEGHWCGFVGCVTVRSKGRLYVITAQ